MSTAPQVEKYSMLVELKFDDSSKAAAKAIEDFQKQFRALAVDVKSVSKDLAGIPGLDRFNSQIATVNRAIDPATRSMQGWTDRMRDFEAQMETLPQKIAATTARMRELEAAGQQGSAAWTANAAELNRLNDAQAKLQAASKGSVDGFRSLRLYAQNASYQITDFVVSVQNGTRASVALGQQLPQLLGAFGSAGAVAGLVVSLATAFAGPFVDAVTKSLDPVGKLSDALKGTKAALDSAQKGFDDFDLTSFRKKFAEASGDVQRFLLSSLQRDIQEAQTKFTSVSEAIKRSVLDVSLDREFGKTFSNAADEFEDFARRVGRAYGVAGNQAKALAIVLRGVNTGTSTFADAANVAATELAKANPKGKQLAADLDEAAKNQIRLSQATKQYQEFLGLIQKGQSVAPPEEKKKIKDYTSELANLRFEIAKISSGPLSNLEEQLLRFSTGVENAGDPTARLKLRLAELQDSLRKVKIETKSIDGTGFTIKGELKVKLPEVKAVSNQLQDLLFPAEALRDKLIAYEEQFAKMTANLTGPELEKWNAAWAKFEKSQEDAIAKLGDSSKDITKQLQDLAVKGIGGLADAIVNADQSFRQFAANFLRQIAKMIIQAQIFSALKGTAFGEFIGVKANAKGNAFSSKTGLPWGVYDSPTFFNMPGFGPLKKFAQGGVLGEAGPEAIMPLKRGSDGRLGVEATPAQVNVNVINNAGAQVDVRQQGNEITVLINQVRQSLISDMRRGGNQFASAMESTYRLSRVGG